MVDSGSGAVSAAAILASHIYADTTYYGYFASVKTVINMINYVVGDIDSALDAINGEVIS